MINVTQCCVSVCNWWPRQHFFVLFLALKKAKKWSLVTKKGHCLFIFCFSVLFSKKDLVYSGYRYLSPQGQKLAHRHISHIKVIWIFFSQVSNKKIFKIECIGGIQFTDLETLDHFKSTFKKSWPPKVAVFKIRFDTVISFYWWQCQFPVIRF